MVARCLLVSANRMALPYPVYPLGVAHIMGAMQRHGHRADHVDILASGGYSTLLKRLEDIHYDVIGISIRNIDTVDSASPQQLLTDITEAIQHIRRHSKARGCKYACGYCSYPTIEGKKLRYRDATEVVGEIELLCREFAARYIFFTDDADLVAPVFYYSPQVGRDFIESRLLSAFRGRKDRIFPVSESENVIPFLHRMGHIGPLWDLLIDTPQGHDR